MRHTTGQIQLLTSQVSETDNDELRRLREYYDRTRLMEGEYQNLQRRFGDQETRLTSLGKTVATVRQIITQAERRAAEWEKRAKETVTEISAMRNCLEEASGAMAQLDSEVFLLKARLREKEADERLTQDRESKLRDQVAALEEQVLRLELESSRSPAHPQSRPTTSATTTSANTESFSVWSSMHNPYRPRGMPNANLSRASKRSGGGTRPPSPTASVVSTSPTVDEDGWWT